MKGKLRKKAFKYVILFIVLIGVFLYAFQYYQLYRIAIAYKNGIYRIDLSNRTKVEETLESLQALSISSFNIAFLSQAAFLLWFYALLLYFIQKGERREKNEG